VNCEPYVVWDEIQSIEYVGEEQVYDIEVEGTHNFIANGILAHNTYMSGNVGIGTTAPGYKLDVNGNFRVGTDSGHRLTIDAGNGEMFHYYGAETQPRAQFDRDFAGGAMDAWLFGAGGSTTMAASGVGI